MSLAYLACILVSWLCLGLVDHRWRLFLFAHPRRALAVLAVGFAFFLAWDLAALDQSIYRRGDSPAMTGIEVADELPLEELFFIAFLCYTTMVLHGVVGLLLARRDAR